MSVDLPDISNVEDPRTNSGYQNCCGPQIQDIYLLGTRKQDPCVPSWVSDNRRCPPAYIHNIWPVLSFESVLTSNAFIGKSNGRAFAGINLKASGKIGH